MALFLGGDDLHDGRNVRFRLGLGIGDMPLLNDEAGAVFADHRLFRRHVHGMTAADVLPVWIAGGGGAAVRLVPLER